LDEFFPVHGRELSAVFEDDLAQQTCGGVWT
jgi:hypothetical protein